MLLRWGVREGAEPPAHTEKILQISAESRKKKILIIFQKLKIAQKKAFIHKRNARSIQIYFANFATSEETRIFGAANGRPWRPNVI